MHNFPDLNLPAYAFRFHEMGGKTMIFDASRRKYVRLTPEEWVRQHFIEYLVQEQGVPRSLLAVEMAFTYQGMARRADVVVHDRRGAPLLMVECKAPEVPIQQTVFDQVARYNKVVRARYLIVTNGLEHFCYMPDAETHSFRFLDVLPHYEAL